MNFDRIIGHGSVVERLRRAVEAGLLPHALLFHGPRHLGKRTLAMALASALLAAPEPALHADFTLVERGRDPKTGKLRKGIAIDDVRSLRERLRLTAFSGGAKVALIDEAESMSEEASNALLKTFEEPSPGTIIVLVAHDPYRLPATIRSRAAAFRLAPVPLEGLVDGLLARGIGADEAREAASLSGGRPGLATRFAEKKDVLDWYRSEERRWQALRTAPLHRRFSLASELVPARGDREEAVDRLRDVLDLWEATLRRDLQDRSLRAAAALRRLSEFRADLRVNVQPKLLLERFLIALDA
jgi:DNA polymerase-3 subunit delta'